MIYFIRSLRSGYIKIGTTEHLRKRMTENRNEEGGIEFLGWMPGSYHEETKLHKVFGETLAYKKEWFHDTPSLRMFIELNSEKSHPDLLTMPRKNNRPSTAPLFRSISVSELTNKLLMEVSRLRGVPPSEAIISIITEQYPDIQDDIQRHQQNRKIVQQLKSSQ